MSGLQRLLNPNALGGSLALQTERPYEWLLVLASLAGLVASGAWIRSRRPGWALGGVAVCMWALTTAYIGFVWDVAWHADTGRDVELFTVPHSLILLGLLGMVLAAATAIALATAEKADVALRWRNWRVPYSSIPMFLLGAGAVSGFPLDDFWHANYGIDVTMWSPTHLLMIGGASLSPLAMWLMLREGNADATDLGRRRWLTMGGVVLVGLSTFQLEYDMDIPQWQVLFQPVLIAAAAGVGLVMARVAVGRGGALLAAGGFIVIRSAIAILVGPLLHHTVPHFPLYLGAAAVIEVAFLALGSAPILWRGVAGGLLASTLGLGAEWTWTDAWSVHPWQPSLLPYLWIAVLAGVAGSVVGVAAGQVLARERTSVPTPLVAVSLVALAVLIGFHLPLRSGAPGQVTIATRTVGAERLVVNRYGVSNTRRDVSLDVTVTPTDAAAGADRFDVVAWQGGPPVEHFRLIEISPGHYRADRPVPTGGSWKSLVFLTRGDQVAAAPVAMTADPAYSLAEIPPLDQRTGSLDPASRYLMREFKPDVVWPIYVILALFVLAIAAWATSLGLAYRAVLPPAQVEPRSARRARTAY